MIEGCQCVDSRFCEQRAGDGDGDGDGDGNVRVPTIQRGLHSSIEELSSKDHTEYLWFSQRVSAYRHHPHLHRDRRNVPLRLVPRKPFQ